MTRFGAYLLTFLALQKILHTWGYTLDCSHLTQLIKSAKKVLMFWRWCYILTQIMQSDDIHTKVSDVIVNCDQVINSDCWY